MYTMFFKLIFRVMDKGERICHICKIEFKYPSKLIRHLQSAKHIAYETNLLGETNYEVIMYV